MPDDFPPVYKSAVRERVSVGNVIEVARTSQNGEPGIHLIIEGVSYYIPKAEARRVARRILFGVDV